MMTKHIDLFAVALVLFAVFFYTQVQGLIAVRVLSQRVPLRIRRMVIQPPEPPVLPIAFMK